MRFLIFPLRKQQVPVIDFIQQHTFHSVNGIIAIGDFKLRCLKFKIGFNSFFSGSGGHFTTFQLSGNKINGKTVLTERKEFGGGRRKFFLGSEIGDKNIYDKNTLDTGDFPVNNPVHIAYGQCIVRAFSQPGP